MEKTITVHSYDKVTREYTGELIARLCPVTNKEYLMPANSTLLEPPTKVDGQAIVFADDCWTYIEDNRGKAVYSKENGDKVGSIVKLYDNIKDDYTLLVPIENSTWDGVKWVVVPATTEELEAKAIAEVIVQRNKERGSLAEQWEFFLDNGYEATKAKDDAIKLKYPKTTK